jgi:hypothetical protein
LAAAAPDGAGDAPGAAGLGQRIGWTNVPVALWPLKSTLAMLPSRAWATNSEYGIAAADGLPNGTNRMMFQTRMTARRIRPITQPGNRGRPGPPPFPGFGHVGRRL